MALQPLSVEQVEAYWEQGYLFLPDALTPTQLSDLSSDFDAWKEESRSHTEAYGETVDKRARFDLEPGHSSDSPALRRVASPIEVSEAYLEAIGGFKELEVRTRDAWGNQVNTALDKEMQRQRRWVVCGRCEFTARRMLARLL